jgi:hypothetical protein
MMQSGQSRRNSRAVLACADEGLRGNSVSANRPKEISLGHGSHEAMNITPDPVQGHQTRRHRHFTRGMEHYGIRNDDRVLLISMRGRAAYAIGGPPSL